MLRPGDAMARPVQSTNVPSNNVLLKVTVPKRTGRKRKRGSNGPFTGPDAADSEETGPPRRTAKDLLRSLSDNPTNYQIEPVGSIAQTHVFRGLFGHLAPV
jgi:general transcription factor 3C polypeptide 5 (transcription factor C subunit 1)